MGLWNRLTGGGVYTGPTDVVSPWQAPDQLDQITFETLYPGVDPEAFAVTRSEAMTVPAVAACRHRIVGTLARLPMIATKGGSPYGGDTGLLDQPDASEPHVVTMTKTLDDLLFDGVAYWLVYDDTGTVPNRPRSIVYIPAGDITFDADGVPAVSDNFTAWLHQNRTVYTLVDGTFVARSASPLTLPDPNPDRPRMPWLIRFDGPHSGICSFGGRAIRSAVDLDRAARHAADNPVPSIELHQTTDADLDDVEIRDLVQSWTGARRRGGVGYTNAAIELRTHGQQPEQLLIDGRNQQAVEISRLTGIPAASIDAGIPGAALTYQNMNDRLGDFVQFGLAQYAVAITARLSMNDCLPDGARAEFDYTELYPVPVAPPSVAPAAAPASPPQLRSVP